MLPVHEEGGSIYLPEQEEFDNRMPVNGIEVLNGDSIYQLIIKILYDFTKSLFTLIQDVS